MGLNDVKIRTDDPESKPDCRQGAHNTNTEHSGEENNLEEPFPVVLHTPYNNSHDIPVYHGKDNKCHCFRHVPSVLGLTRNLVVRLPGVKNIAKGKKRLWIVGSTFFPILQYNKLS